MISIEPNEVSCVVFAADTPVLSIDRVPIVLCKPKVDITLAERVSQPKRCRPPERKRRGRERKQGERVSQPKCCRPPDQKRGENGSKEGESHSRNAVDHQTGREERAEARRERKQGGSGSEEGESHS